MTGFRTTRQASSLRPRAGGFTLIELLAVIAILAILVGLVVGVGRELQGKAHRSETLMTMQVLVSAMDAYKDTCSEYPPDHDTGWTAAPVDQYHAGDGIGVLWMYLTGKHYSADTSTSTVNCDLSAQSCVQAVKTKLDKLPAGATVLLPTPAFSDGYGTPMRYQLLGGKPLLLSAGPDATFGTGDDIRSDNR